ncbi:MAG: hypothetical protein OXD35_09240 [Thiotrichales bacterium]|nr:hypothetical protein [Thiotrichales bacterium]
MGDALGNRGLDFGAQPRDCLGHEIDPHPTELQSEALRQPLIRRTGEKLQPGRLPETNPDRAVGVLRRLDEQIRHPRFDIFVDVVTIRVGGGAIGPRGKTLCKCRARIGSKGPSLRRPRLLHLSHELKRGLQIVIDDEIAPSAEEVAPLGSIERSEARLCMRLKGVEKLRRQDSVLLREHPAILFGRLHGLRVEEHRIEVQVVCRTGQSQRKGGAGVDAKVAEERAHLGRLVALVVGVEKTTEPRKRVPVIRQADRARLEPIGKLHERELGVGNEKRPLRRFEERTAPTGDHGAIGVGPVRMQLEVGRADDAARIGGKREGRTAGEPQGSSLSCGQRCDGGVRSDDTIGLDTHRVRVDLAILAKRS